jgi:hypothetical protein
VNDDLASEDDPARSLGLPEAAPDASVLRELLSAKAVSLGEEVTNLLPKMENFLGVSVAILVGAVTLGATDKHPVIFVILPFPLIVLFTYLLQANTEMLSRAGHKRALEEMVNRLASRPVMFEESYVAPRSLHGPTHFGRWSIVLIQAALIGLLVGVAALALANLGAVGGTGWKVLVAAGLALGVAMLASAAIEQGQAYKKAYDAAYAGFSGVAPPPSALLGQRRSSNRPSVLDRFRSTLVLPARWPSRNPDDYR